MWQAEFKLYLYPEDPDYCYDEKKLSLHLKESGFIDEKLSQNRFSVGGRFLSLLTFMGCSPDIELQPQEDSAYCYVEFTSATQPQFISGSNLKKAHCPQCKEPVSAPLMCEHCKQRLDPATLNWRKTAFYASSWITIGNIYELEAIPSDQLLTILQKETTARWKPAYIRLKPSPM